MVEQLALIGAGVIAPFITQYAKKQTGYKKYAILALSAIVAVFLAYVAFFITSIFDTSIKLDGLELMEVWGVGQVIYNVFIKK